MQVMQKHVCPDIEKEAVHLFVMGWCHFNGIEKGHTLPFCNSSGGIESWYPLLWASEFNVCFCSLFVWLGQWSLNICAGFSCHLEFQDLSQ